MKIAIAGYGALGKAVETEVQKRKDMTLVSVFTRREPSFIKTASAVNVFGFDEAAKHKDEIDVVINCMGSATDLPVTTPFLSEYFNVVDSFDTHSKFEEHFMRTDRYAKKGQKLSLISCGWDPGLFSLARAYMRCVLPLGTDYTFWGEGVSRGHSNAVRNIEGVIDAVQYTVPIGSAVCSVRNGEFPNLSEEKMHKRVCYVVAEAGANTDRIKNEIKSMPAYFAPYETEVNFIDYESFLQEHKTEKHAGSVMRCFKDDDYSAFCEFSLKLSSNPLFTASVLLSYAAAVFDMNKSGKSGCITVFDVSASQLIKSNGIFQKDII